MITEGVAAEIESYAAYFAGAQPEMVVASITAGNTEAQLWRVDQPDAAPAVLLWDKGNNVLYCAGQLVSPAARQALAALIDRTIRPRAIQERLSRFNVRALTPSFEDALPALFGGIALRETRTLFYRYVQQSPAVVQAPAVEDAQLVPIDRALLERGELEHIARVRDEIRWMWPSEQRFYEHGFGYAALKQARLICWCTAEYVSASRCGIGIETDACYERRGVATATAARFVQECQRRGVQPAWECATTNLGSIRVAEKVGFERIAEERFWLGVFDG